MDSLLENYECVDFYVQSFICRCTCVHVCICMYVYIYIYIYTDMCIDISIHADICTHLSLLVLLSVGVNQFDSLACASLADLLCF